MFGVWLAVVVVDGILAATLFPSNTAGYLSLAGGIGVLVWTWGRYSPAETRAGSDVRFGDD